jgi:hypothetical protein
MPLAARDKADLTRIETLAKEILQQVEYLRRNGHGDEIRFGFIELRGYDIFQLSRRGLRRHERRGT